MKKNKLFLVIALLFMSTLFITGCVDNNERKDAKPVIYLYPDQITDVTVHLTYNGELTCTYPTYDNGWNVTAYPDGKLINHADGDEYSYLFWEGISNMEYDMSKGFIVKGEDTEAFLKEKLSYLGLNANEYNEFIVYWLPQMMENPYNLISFQGENYTENAMLEINPKPDSILRVFMEYQPLEEPIEVDVQVLEPFERLGFSVIEWGGTVLE